MNDNHQPTQNNGRSRRTPDNTDIDEFDLAQDLMGDNALAGDDQENVPNERKARASATGETDGLVESFKKLDKRYRTDNEGMKGDDNGNGPGSEDTATTATNSVSPVRKRRGASQEDE